jgi:hypothetical protein
MYYCIPYHTENKTLVPEWPTFIDVYSFSSHLQLASNAVMMVVQTMVKSWNVNRISPNFILLQDVNIILQQDA